MPTLDSRVSLHYPPGTHVASVCQPRIDMFDLEDIRRCVFEAMHEYRKEHGNIDVEDLFITIGYTTTEIIVEVSDRLVPRNG